MGSVISNFLAEAAIIPQANNSFWGMVGSFFVNAGAWLLYMLANIVYALCKFALNIIDFMQLLVEKLAGLDAWMHLEKLDMSNLKETDVVFRFLLSDTVLNVFRTLFAIFIVLLIFFTIVAIIKNEYGNVTASEKDAVDHKKSIGTALKAIATVMLVPIILIVGILTSNAILASILKAFQLGDNVTIGSQLFVASSYDASLYRLYASDGSRKAVSNMVQFRGYDADGSLMSEDSVYKVNTAIPTVVPSDYDTFYGYMFTFDGDTYFIWDVGEEVAYDKNHENSTYRDVETNTDLRIKYYNYIKYVLGAYIVEQNTSTYFKDSDSALNVTKNDNISAYYKENYNDTQKDSNVIQAVESKWNAYRFSYLMDVDGFVRGYPMYKTNVGEFILDCAYNTWGYNDTLNTTVKKWNTEQDSLYKREEQVENGAGSIINAVDIQNSQNWGRLHDGGVNGFAPLSQEYEVMADVIDFMIQNNTEIYFVNANNPNIGWNVGGYEDENAVDSRTLVYKNNMLDGFLVYYKEVEKPVVYHIDYDAISEIEGATYIVCIYNAVTSRYIPLVNDSKVYDQRGNSYEFHSGTFSSTYHGVVVAHALFEESNVGSIIPMYLSQSAATESGSTVAKTTDLTNAQTKIVAEKYSFLDQKTDATKENVTINSSASDKSLFIDSRANKAVYYDARSILQIAANANELYNYFADNISTKFLSGYDYKGYDSNFLSLGDEPTRYITLYFQKQGQDPVGYNYYALKFTLSSDLTNLEKETTASGVELNAYHFNIEQFAMYGDFGAPTIVNANNAIGDGILNSNNGVLTFYTGNSTQENDIYNTSSAENIVFVSSLIDNLLKNSQNSAISYEKIANNAVICDETNKTITVKVWGTDTTNNEEGSRIYIVTLSVNSFETQNIEGTDYGVYTISTNISSSEVVTPVLYSGYTGVIPDNKIVCLDGNFYSFSDSKTLNEIEDRAQSTTQAIADNLVNGLFAQTYFGESSFELASMNLGGYNLSYSANMYFNVKNSDGEDFFKINLNQNIAYVNSTFMAADEEEILMYKFDYTYAILNTYDLYYSTDYQNIVAADRIAANLTYTDFLYAGVYKYDTYNSSWQPSDQKSVYQFTYNIPVEGRSSTLTVNAVSTSANCDGGYDFIGFKKGVAKSINSSGAYYPESLVFKYDIVRIVYTNSYSMYAANEPDTIYIIDADNATLDSVSVYKAIFTENGMEYSKVDGTGGYDGENLINYINSRIKVETYAVSVQDWYDFDTLISNRYAQSIRTISGTVLYFNSSDVVLPSGQDFAECEVIGEYFTRNLAVLGINGTYYNRTTSLAGSSSDDGFVEKLNDQAKSLLKNPITINFCRDKIENQWICADIKFGLTWDPGFSLGWRFHIAARNYQAKNVVYSNGTASIAHDNVLSISYGKILKDYSFSGGGVELGNAYRIMNFNWLILIFSIVLVISVLGTSVWGLIKRIYQITLLFLMMPPIAATLPIDPKGKRFNDWKDKVIKEVLGAYGVTIALNFVFMIFPVIRQASAIFTDEDVASLTGAVKWFAHSADRLNWITYILFMLVAFTLFKSVPKFIADVIGAGDVFTSGGETKAAVAKTVSDVAQTVSGQKAKDSFNKFKEDMVGSKKNPGGLLTPGYAIGKGIYDKYKAKRDKKKGDDESKVKADAENRANAEAEAKMNAGDAIVNPPEKETPPVDEALANKIVTDLRDKDNMQSFMNDETNGKYAEVARNAYDEALKANGGDELAAGQAAYDAAQQEAKKDLEAIANGENGANAENAATAQDAEHAAVADRVAEKDAETENAAKQYAEASKSYAEASKTYANIAGGKLDAYKRDISEINKEEKAKAIEEKHNAIIDEAREKGKRGNIFTRGLSDAEKAAWNASNDEDHQIKDVKREDFKTKAEYQEAVKKQKQILYRAEMEKYLNKLENNKIDEENGIKHGIGASIRRKLVGGRKTENQRQKEAEIAKEARANLERNIKETNLANFSKDYQKARKSIEAEERESGANLTNRQRQEAINKEFKRIQDNRAKKMTKEVEKLEKIAMDDKKGALLKAGRGVATVGKGIAIAGTKVASGLRNSGLGELTLGASEKSKQAAQKLLDKRDALENDVLERAEKLKVAQAEHAKTAQAFDQANAIAELRRLNTQINDPKLKGREKGNIRKEMLELIEYNNKNNTFKGTQFEQAFKEVKNQKNAEALANMLNEAATKDKSGLFDLKARMDDRAKAERKLNGLQKKDENGKTQLDKAIERLDAFNDKHTEKEFARARRITDETNNNVFRVGLAKAFHNSRAARGVRTGAKAFVTSPVKLAKWINDTKVGKVVGFLPKLAGKGIYKGVTKVGGATVGRYKAWKGNVEAARADMQANYKESAAERNARRKENEAYIGELLLKREDATAKAMVKKLRDNIKAGKFKGDSTDAYKLAQKYMDSRYNKKNGTNIELTDEERARLAKYLGKKAAVRSTVHTTAQKRMASQSDKVVASMDKRHDAEIKALKREIGRLNRDVDKAIEARRNASNDPASSVELQRYIKEELRKELRRKQAELMNTTSKSEVQKLNSEIKSMKDILSKVNKTNSTYKRDLKRLQEADRKMGKQLKNTKSQNALAQATKTSSSFGEGASGKD